jgi:hypothetical protein
MSSMSPNAPQKTKDDRESSDETRHSEFHAQRSKGAVRPCHKFFTGTRCKIEFSGVTGCSKTEFIFTLHSESLMHLTVTSLFDSWALSCQNVVFQKRKPFCNAVTSQ